MWLHRHRCGFLLVNETVYRLIFQCVFYERKNWFLLGWISWCWWPRYWLPWNARRPQSAPGKVAAED